MVELRLTYEELAQQLKIKPVALRQRAKRRRRQGRWRIVHGDDGRAIVHLEEAQLADEPRGRSAEPKRPAGNRVGPLAKLRARVSALEAERATLVEQLGATRERMERVEGELTELRKAQEREAATLRDALSHFANCLDLATTEPREFRQLWWRQP